MYVTDTLKDIARNTANINGGSSPSERWFDLLNKSNVPADNRTVDEKVADIATKAGIEVIDG